MKRIQWNTDLFKEQMKKTNPNIVILGEYKNNKTGILAKCKKCGYVWNPLPCNLLKGSGCNNCSGHVKITKDMFREKMRDINPSIELIGEYKGTQIKTIFKCKKCGYIWEAKPTTLLRGHGCQQCYGTRKLTEDEYRERLDKVNNQIIVISEYINARTKLICQCKVCGNEWKSKPSDLLKGHGCPNCAKNGTSYVEQVILYSLKELFGYDNVESRNRSCIGKELDIFIPQLSFAIEPGSWFFHKKKYKNDLEKIALCNNKGIELMVIYTDFDYSTTLDERILFFEENLGREKDDSLLRDTIQNIIFQLGEKTVLSDKQWVKIKKLARAANKRMSREDFERLVNKKGANVYVLTDYTRRNDRIRCKCKKCNHEWNPIAGDIMNGSGCPLCANKERNKRLSQEEFEERISDNIEILGNYSRTVDRIKCKCKKCGYVWDPIANQLLRGGNCPNCYRTKRGQSLRLTQEEFEKRVYSKNDSVIIIGDYVNSRTDIEYKCKICGRIRTTRASNLLAGCGCRECYSKRNKFIGKE